MRIEGSGRVMDLSRKVFLSLAGVLLGLGCLMVYSASVTSRPTEFEQVYLLRQVAAGLLGLLAAALAGCLAPRHWKALAPYLFWGVLLLLIAVLIPGIGTRVKGAQRWIRILGVSVQPSELAKIALPLWTAVLITSRRDRLNDHWGNALGVLWPTLLAVPLILVEPDLGTAVFLVLAAGIALFVAGWHWKRFAIGFTVLAVPASLGFFLLKPYQQRRLIGFLETWTDLDAAPYQIKQSLVTLGAGGWTGSGLGKGWQKLSFLPEANTDFVFAVIGEELGFVGTVGLITVWCGLYVTGMRLLSAHEPRSFPFLAGMTLLTQLVLQAMFNVAVVTAMIPPKGIAHPLISAGGSNLVVSLVTLGVIWSLTKPDSAQNADSPSTVYQGFDPPVPIRHPPAPLAPTL